MIAKIMKRSSFGNVVNYVFKDGKDVKLLALQPHVVPSSGGGGGGSSDD